MKWNWKPVPTSNRQYSSWYQPPGNPSTNQHNQDIFPNWVMSQIEPAPLKSLNIVQKTRKSKIPKTSGKYNLLDKAGYARTLATVPDNIWRLTVKGIYKRGAWTELWREQNCSLLYLPRTTAPMGTYASSCYSPLAVATAAKLKYNPRDTRPNLGKS